MTAESGHGASWVEVTYAGATYDVKIEATAGTYAAGLRWGVSTDDGEPGIVALFDGDTANYSKGVAEPRSVGVSSAGQVVIADWIEYGTSTESRVAVLDTAGEIRYADELDHGAVLVDISDDGTHIAVSTYESAVRVYNVETGELLGCRPAGRRVCHREQCDAHSCARGRFGGPALLDHARRRGGR